MTDDMDGYISRCLKNWTARQPAPEGGREALLARASTSDWDERGLIVRLFSSIQVRVRTSPEPFYPNSHLPFMQPFTLSTLWSFHLLADQRLAT